MVILDQIKAIKSDRSDLRNFGITMAVALGIIGGILLWRGNTYYTYFFGIGALLLILGLILPVVLKPFQKVWMTLSILMGWVMTKLILLALFYLVFTPVGLVARLFGHKFLETRMNRTAGSYWVYRDKAAPDKIDYERQF